MFSFKKANKLSSFLGVHFKSFILYGIGTSEKSETNFFDTIASSALLRRLSLLFSCLIELALSRSFSRDPNSLINCDAVLTPIPGTPGTLSEESPANA